MDKVLYGIDDFFSNNPDELLPQWVNSAFQELDDSLKHRDFPCILGVMAHRKGLTKTGFLSIDDNEKGKKLSSILDAYIDELRLLEDDKLAGLLPLIVFIEIDQEKTLEDSHHTAWKHLTEALKYDKYEWLEDVPKDSSSPDFAYCYSGERWFVNVSSYFHHERRSRHLGSTIVLAMQTLNGSNRFFSGVEEKIMWQKKIRERTRKYDGGMDVYAGLGPLIDHGEPRPFPESYFIPDNNHVSMEKFWEGDVKMYEYILFDFDGTLADSSECSVIATRSAFEGMGLAAPAASDITDQMGIPIEKSFRDMGAKDFSAEQFDRLLNLFREIYREVGDSHISAFSGAVDLLKELQAAGKKIAIITSKKTDVAVRNAEKLGLNAYVDLIVGSDKVSEYKPHPEGIFTALAQFGVEQAHYGKAIMVGDAVTDIEMGKNAGVATCAVTWGAHSKQRLESAAPEYVADSFMSLFTVLNKDKVKCPFHR